MSRDLGRFAPSITGIAHPGTLLAALLAWLDARSVGANMLLRLEDVDHTRLRPGQRESMLDAMAWLGIDWDQLVIQSEQRAEHELAMDRLASQGLLYPCRCSRKLRRQEGRRSPEGGYAYNNRCRHRSMPPGNWRDCSESIRLRLPSRAVTLRDESGLDLSQNPAQEMGDPILRRASGVLAYHLVVVVDDASSGVTRVVRGRDLAASTATQVHLQTLLGFSSLSYRHHFLLLDSRSEKLSKVNASIPIGSLRAQFSGPEFCGHLAQLAGLRTSAEACSPRELVSDFSWERVRCEDLLYEHRGIGDPHRGRGE